MFVQQCETSDKILLTGVCEIPWVRTINRSLKIPTHSIGASLICFSPKVDLAETTLGLSVAGLWGFGSRDSIHARIS